MTGPAPSLARQVLLVEDNPGDATLVVEHLRPSPDDDERYELVTVETLAAAAAVLAERTFDVVLLDLTLPDGQGTETVTRLHQVAGTVPIVVLTGLEDHRMAYACIQAGAEDYLAKFEVKRHTLQRALGYAIGRRHEAEMRRMRMALAQYRALSSAGQGTSVTAALSRSGAISLRHPDLFEDLVDDYVAVIGPYLSRNPDRTAHARTMMERIVTRVGDTNGGPRDLLDVHVAALDRAIAPDGADAEAEPGGSSVLFEARLLALEMMGLLVDHYRVGHRRWFTEEQTP